MPDPRPRSGLKALLVAAVIAAVLFVTLILPAEFGRDPTGVGRLLGITGLSAGGADEPASSPQLVTMTDVIGGNERIVTVDPGDGREPVPLPNPAVHQAEAAAPKSETVTVELGFDQKTEIKTKLAKGKMVLYSWEVEGGKVYVDFHGHDPALGEKFWVRYSEEDGIDRASGSLVAPFDGEHGWFWLNVAEGPVKIHLTVTGYYDSLVNYGIIP
jgi:hypothetical protein